MRRRLVSAARSAIRMRSTESDRSKAITELRKDILNGPRHCFGHHDHCSSNFCTTAKEKSNLLCTRPGAIETHDETDGDDTDGNEITLQLYNF